MVDSERGIGVVRNAKQKNIGYFFKDNLTASVLSKFMFAVVNRMMVL